MLSHGFYLALMESGGIKMFISEMKIVNCKHVIAK